MASSMTAVELLDLAEKAGMNVGGLARFLEVRGRTVRRWLTGEDMIPDSVVMLLRVMDDFGLKAADMKRDFGSTDETTDFNYHREGTFADEYESRAITGVGEG